MVLNRTNVKVNWINTYENRNNIGLVQLAIGGENINFYIHPDIDSDGNLTVHFIKMQSN